MTRSMKSALVAAGYALALVASTLAATLYDRQFSAADNQTMGGMIAGGEMMLGGAVFAFMALVPTGLALWFLRGSRRFWNAFSTAVLAFAIVGLTAVLSPFALGGVMPRDPLFQLVGLFGVVQMLGSPLWIAGFALFAILAPAPSFRRCMLIAVAIEVVIAGCALLHFLVPTPPL